MHIHYLKTLLPHPHHSCEFFAIWFVNNTFEMIYLIYSVVILMHRYTYLSCVVFIFVFGRHSINLSKTEVGFVLHSTSSYYLNCFIPIILNPSYLKNVTFRKFYLGIIRSFRVVSKHKISSFCLEYGLFRELKTLHS